MKKRGIIRCFNININFFLNLGIWLSENREIDIVMILSYTFE